MLAIYVPGRPDYLTKTDYFLLLFCQTRCTGCYTVYQKYIRVILFYRDIVSELSPGLLVPYTYVKPNQRTVLCAYTIGRNSRKIKNKIRGDSMKKLYLLRHAKSSWSNPALRDYDRPLNSRGRRQAEAMGKYFQEKAFEIDRIFCSGAQRTRETLDLLLESYAYQGEIEYMDEIYAASVYTLKGLIKQVNFDSLLLIGHNPEIEALAEDLTGQILIMPTCMLAVIDMETGKLEIFTRPE
ncbi:MAG: histidine phosphatase family protein [Saccharofermentanales bacterium]